MPPRDSANPRPSLPLAGDGSRQLTLGEVIAIGRYGPHWTSANGKVDLDALLVFIDALGVCTTCGWSKPLHKVDKDYAQELNICAQFTRRR